MIGPTKEQDAKMNEVAKLGFKFDKELTCSFAAVIMRKDKDIWIFGLNGQINFEANWESKVNKA